MLPLGGFGSALASLIREYEASDNIDPLRRFQCIKVEPSLLCTSQGFLKNASSVKLVFNELRIEIWKCYQFGAANIFESNSEAKRHGVTFLHLLDHLVGWNGLHIRSSCSQD